ncbi:MAG: STAS domain-containing protein [Melioribacteraceae bacterium]|nr:STAS domain-containing protein [Melioribacteraceae bacterium]MCF8356504.1 STAS domain-containing protein [Melioribacteraceae bacterium]MCF8395892.1 STAS domain-containing protein [Melioribacteraceae bacterium]MCF8420945.1 STAS domain-containing protein [Melioribacteraceae bacterium]
MDIIEEKIGDVLVEIVNLDRATLKEAGDLKDIMYSRIEEGYRKLIVDLSTCEFIDSTFLGVLVNTLKRVAKMDGDLRLVGFQPAVHSMFQLTRMYRVFETFPDLKEAIGSYSR